MIGEVTFDTEVADTGQDHIEGCYRVDGEAWKVYYFTHWRDGRRWQGDPIITTDAVWQSGITGVEVLLSKDTMLNKATVVEILSALLGVSEWSEVPGPDSLQLK